MKEPEYITCRELIEFLMDYIDDTLPADRRSEFERHLAVCPSCVAYLESYQQAIKLGKLALAPTDEPAAGSVPQGLIKAIREARLKGA